MRILSVIALGAGIVLCSSTASYAQTGMRNGSNDAGTSKARCSPGDPNVMLNVKTKTFTLDTPAKSPSKSTSSSSGAHMSKSATSHSTTTKGM